MQKSIPYLKTILHNEQSMRSKPNLYITNSLVARLLSTYGDAKPFPFNKAPLLGTSGLDLCNCYLFMVKSWLSCDINKALHGTSIPATIAVIKCKLGKVRGYDTSKRKEIAQVIES